MTAEKTNLSRTVAEGTALFTINTVMQKLTGVITVLLITRTLSVYSFGVLRLIQSAISAVGSFYFSGMNSVIIAEAARARGEGEWGRLRAMLRAYARILLGIGGALTVLAAALAAVVDRLFGREWAVLTLLGSGFVFLGGLSIFVPTVLQAFTRFRALVAMRVVEQVGTLAAVAIAVFFWRGSVVAVLAAYLAAGLIALLAILPTLGATLAPLRAAAPYEFSFVGLVRRQGLWAIFVDYTRNITENIRLWIIGGVLGIEAVALYSLAESIFGHTVSLFPLSQTLLPVVSAELSDESRLRRVFIRSVKYHFLAFTLLAIAGWTLFPPLLALFFPKYLPAIGLYQVMIIGLIISAPAPTLNVFLTALRQQRALWFLMLARSAIVIAGIYAATKLFGLFGMAVEFLITWAFFTWSRMILLLRVAPNLRFLPRELFVIDEYDRRALSWARNRIVKIWKPKTP